MNWALRLEFEPRDFWVGLYWNNGPAQKFDFDGTVGRHGGRNALVTDYERVDVYLCLVPCWPVHVWSYL